MSPKTNEISSPPKPRMTFRVGVVGHRPNRLGEAHEQDLRNVIRTILATIKKEVTAFQEGHKTLYGAAPYALRVVSPLAEGSDRIVADEATKLGYRLHCPMPFPQSEYEKDFVSPRALVPGSLDEFRRLLDLGRQLGADARLELDGSREDEGRAYAATGRIVLNHSDILIAIWDGKPSQGEGGTVEKLQEALRFGVPVVWVDAVAPHSWCTVRTEDQVPSPSSKDRAIPKQATDLQDVENLVKELLGPPESIPVSRYADATAKSNLREDFFREKWPRWNFAFLWKAFRDFVGDGRLRLQSVKVADFERSLKDDWPTNAPGVEGWANQALRKYYAWSDMLADFYADWYRSAFVSAFLFSVVAVMLALAPLSVHYLYSTSQVPEGVADGDLTSTTPGRDAMATLCAIAEPVVILYIVLVIWLSWRGRWHERWMDYRLIAELIRQLRFLSPLGGGRPFPRIPPHLAGYGDPARTWMYWYVRAIEREVGMPNVRIDGEYLKQTLRYLRGVLVGQQHFHAMASDRSRRIERRLHVGGVSLFIATFFTCLLHFLPHGGAIGLPSIEFPGWLPPYSLAVLCAVMPALGAALAGINNQGEFGRISKRSQAMSQRLGQMDRRVDELLKQADLGSREVIVQAYELAQLMVDEFLDWRVVFKDRPPVLPA